jgi:hypothetical protein
MKHGFTVLSSFSIPSSSQPEGLSIVSKEDIRGDILEQKITPSRGMAGY